MKMVIGLLFLIFVSVFSNAKVEPKRYVALTFDDGPRPAILEKLLPYFEQEGIRATFFPMGVHVIKNGDWIKKLVAQGHEVENHSFSHPILTKMPLSQAIRDVEKESDLIEKIIGYRTQFFRPPFFAINQKLRQELTRRGFYVLIHGRNSIGSLDWVYLHSPSKIVYQVKRTVELRGKRDYVVIFHELDNTLNALPEIIRYFKDNGYTFVRLDEFVKLCPKAEI